MGKKGGRNITVYSKHTTIHQQVHSPESSSLVLSAETNGHFVSELRNGDSMLLWTQPRHSPLELGWAADAEMTADKPRDVSGSSHGS